MYIYNSINISYFSVYKLLAPPKHGFKANLPRGAVRRNCNHKPDKFD